MTGKLTPEKDGAAKAAPRVPAPAPEAPVKKSGEIGGRNAPEPTRYGDWEVRGICSDF
ncbi:MAG: DUF1674 domain-containing protein [Sandarakinorhabdus sp.]|nr:DUF1674 domain-containing protein [Sandarakinorhabdus sp.]